MIHPTNFEWLRSYFRLLGHFSLDRITSLVAIRIRTGRRHQIRVHLQSCGCPSVADHRYGLTEVLVKAMSSESAMASWGKKCHRAFRWWYPTWGSCGCEGDRLIFGEKNDYLECILFRPLHGKWGQPASGQKLAGHHHGFCMFQVPTLVLCCAVTLWWTNIGMKKGPWMKMYFPLTMGIFRCYVYYVSLWRSWPCDWLIPSGSWASCARGPVLAIWWGWERFKERFCESTRDYRRSSSTIRLIDSYHNFLTIIRH